MPTTSARKPGNRARVFGPGSHAFGTLLTPRHRHSRPFFCMRPQVAAVCLSMALITLGSLPAKEPKHPAPPTPWLESIEHAPHQPKSGELVRITAQVRPGVTNVALEYQVVEPGVYVELK